MQGSEFPLQETRLQMGQFSSVATNSDRKALV